LETVIRDHDRLSQVNLKNYTINLPDAMMLGASDDQVIASPVFLHSYRVTIFATVGRLAAAAAA